ncbi:MAG TPA: thioredoxin domain-containing protein [Gemmatimonadaceae bacterium]|jgi:protein-disulfide isomerase
MAPPIRVLAAISFAAIVCCQGADAARRESASSTASASAASAAKPAAALSPGRLTDSVSEHADSGRILGNPQATLWIVEASDFQCPFCKMWHDSTYGSVVRDYVQTGRVRLAYLNYPLSQHQNAMPAAEAAMCASVQNRFWPMHDALFSSQASWEMLPNAMPKFDSIAARIGVAIPAWRDCVARHLTRPLIEADYARSQSAGVKSTPTFFIGDQQLAGFQPYAFFRQVIEAQLAKKGASR